jgi:DNA-binding transcriptional regulator LsrR (DeoR family)
MATAKTPQTRELVFEAAWHYSLGIRVEEIAEVTGRSKPTIYRALEQARDLGWLDDRPRLTLPYGDERDQLERHIRDHTKGNQVADLFGKDVRPREVIVVPSPTVSTAERLDAAVCVVLRSSRRYHECCQQSVAVDWSRALPALVKEVAAQADVQAAAASSEAIAEATERCLQRPFTRADDERSRRIGSAAATRLVRAIEEGHARRIGVSWGHNVREMARAATVQFAAYPEWSPQAARRDKPLPELLVFPLIGALAHDPFLDFRGREAEYGAGANCAALARQFGAPEPLVITQPAAIPPKFSDAEGLRQIYKYLDEDQSLRLLYGEELARSRITEHGLPLPDPIEQLYGHPAPEISSGGWVEQSDTLISGIGACSWDSRAPRLGLITDEELQAFQEMGTVCGDLSGQFIWDPRKPPTEAQKEVIRRVNVRILSPRLGDFAMATRRARQAHKPVLGTMVLAVGARKAASVAAACRWGIVNCLVCDSDLANALIASE